MSAIEFIEFRCTIYSDSHSLIVSDRFKLEITRMSLNILPILKTLTTLRRVGDTGKSSMRSSITIPTMEAITRTKSNRFQAVVK